MKWTIVMHFFKKMPQLFSLFWKNILFLTSISSSLGHNSILQDSNATKLNMAQIC
jgi:hypothetical protein